MRLKLAVIFLLLFSFSVKGQSFFERDWKTAIDTTWEQIYSTDEMLTVFDSVWTIIMKEYACFQYLDTNWDSLRQSNRQEIEGGISTGRFTAILNYLGIKLKESHTYIADPVINQNLNPKRGMPVIFQGGWGSGIHFGAGLSPMPDSSLLVYKVALNHPLGLEVGDVILGYEGVPWKKLYKILLEMEFPTGDINVLGGNDNSVTENWLMGAGRNWHLFETIDIKKFGTGDTQRLPTSLLENHEFDLYHSGQLPVPGVEIPENVSRTPITWGVVENTNIGYVYIWSWYDRNISTKFYNAVDSLINILNVKGLIFDVRVNTGGYFNGTNRGLDLLFKKSPSNLGLAIRDSDEDLFLLRRFNTYRLNADSTKYFDGPIAVLTGSLTISAADFFALRLTEHPNVKLFGSPPSGSYSSLKRKNVGRIVISYSYLNGFIDKDSIRYLSHTTLPVDYEASFTPEDVINGTDTVVKEAIKWINENIILTVQNPQIVSEYFLSQNYPNPFNPTTKIKFSIPSVETQYPDKSAIY